MKEKTPKLLLIIVFVFSMASCSRLQEEQSGCIEKVKTYTVENAGSEISKQYSGIIQEAGEMNLSFRLAGPIEKIYVKEGDYVRKGQLIAKMDSRDYEVQYNAIKAQYEQVQAEVKRVEELYKKNSVTPNDYDKAISGEKMLRLKLKNAEDQLHDTKLYAPFSGYIQKVNYDEGELINTGMTVATLIDVSSYEIEVDVPLSLFILKNDFTSYSCQQDMIGEEEFPLKMSGYNKKADNNQLYRLYFRLDPKADERLAPGMNVKVNIQYKSNIKQEVLVPVSAVVNNDKSSCVWVYDTQNSTVSKRKIITGRLAGGGLITVSKGLKQGETIVSAGVHSLKEGQEVKALEFNSDTNIGGLM